MVSEESKKYQECYKYILKLHIDGEKHRQKDIKNKFEPLIFSNEEELSDEKKETILNTYVTWPLQHFRENGFLEKVEVDNNSSWTQITEDGIKLYRLNLPIIKKDILEEYRRKFDQWDTDFVDGKFAIFKDTIISNSESNYIIIENKVFEKNVLNNSVKEHILDSISIGDKEFRILRKEKYNYIILNGKELRLDSNQSSINISKNFYEYAKAHEIIIESDMYHARKDVDGNAYILNDYDLKLGDGIILLIGEKYRNFENKFLASMNPNGKFQIYNEVYSLKDNPEKYENYEKYKDLNLDKEEGYGWFVELIPRTILGSKLIICVSNENKEVTLDLDFNQIMQITSLEEILDDEIQILDDDFPLNRIVFGAPGTGKSCRLEKDKEKFGENYERVTFHPNYSYSQFVGTYKPVPEKDEDGNKTGKITYEYVPGPFIRTFVKASGSNKPYLLLIEEINRANVSAVFGDMFQLLDRKDGESEYDIETSEDMRDYLELEKEKNNLPEDFDINRIRIPNNMYIWATMNSADQGVFPMDTAFKRRWDFEYIGINEEEDDIKDIEFKVCENSKEKAHSVNWNNLRRGINYVLSNDCNINEDKLLGPYFLSGDVIKTNKQINGAEEENLVYDNENFIKAFKSKVLMYLFEDAAKQKQHRQKLFRGCDSPTIAKYSSICNAFDEKGEAIFGEDILSKDKK